MFRQWGHHVPVSRYYGASVHLSSVLHDDTYYLLPSQFHGLSLLVSPLRIGVFNDFEGTSKR